MFRLATLMALSLLARATYAQLPVGTASTPPIATKPTQQDPFGRDSGTSIALPSQVTYLGRDKSAGIHRRRPPPNTEEPTREEPDRDSSPVSSEYGSFSCEP